MKLEQKRIISLVRITWITAFKISRLTTKRRSSEFCARYRHLIKNYLKCNYHTLTLIVLEIGIKNYLCDNAKKFRATSTIPQEDTDHSALQRLLQHHLPPSHPPTTINN
ncbi:uncharacterized protein LOC107981786 isoform X2 [Nasonia vitripennis]|uniref:Uncharacterized protein n=1 Tax=Nasonia vitripennis TaxID=7425 RepID=A0A7M7QFF7_NASVI|nr:uncharacterized protein LOC107981786 isoform X2 [Nasonia vitripennis]